MVTLAREPIISSLDRGALRTALVERMFCAADDVRDVTVVLGENK